jgi:hypothetical protein
MKRIIVFSLIMIMASSLFAQKVIETTYKKFDLGLGLFTDIWQDLPENTDARTINQGFLLNLMYNKRFGESGVSLAIGIGTSFHNLYSNTIIPDIKADSIIFEPIGDSIDYKKSKIQASYFDIPFEFRFRSKKGFRIALGFKAGFLYDSKIKYKGERLSNDGVEIKTKSKSVKQLETVQYGPTFRIGYKWINVFGYFALSKLFKEDRGPQTYPISVGIALIPYQ